MQGKKKDILYDKTFIVMQNESMYVCMYLFANNSNWIIKEQ